MDLDDIAAMLGIDMDELMREIETIVSTGTKLNLDYFIKDNIDEEIEEEIYDYFRNEAASDSLSDAIDALSGNCEELEIRLVRIKFLCEVAS
jgi:ATP-dependent DNA helicase RecQ